MTEQDFEIHVKQLCNQYEKLRLIAFDRFCVLEVVRVLIQKVVYQQMHFLVQQFSDTGMIYTLLAEHNKAYMVQFKALVQIVPSFLNITQASTNNQHNTISFK